MGEMPRLAANSVNPQSGLRAKVNKALTWCVLTDLTFAAIAALGAFFGQSSAVAVPALPARSVVPPPAVMAPDSTVAQTGTTTSAGARVTITRAERVTFSPEIKARRSRVTGEARQLVDFE
jgi:hypothetical protein